MSDARVVLVTGSARGLGREVAERLLDDGWRVHVVHRSPSGREELLAHFGARRVHRADLTEDLAATGLVDAVLSTDGRLDAVVHAVGEYHLAPLSETATATARRLLESNLLSAHALLAASRAVLRESRGAVVLFGCAGTASGRARRDAPAYVAAKAGLLSLMRSAALEEAAHGVRVNMVSPGIVPHPHASPDTLDPDLQARIPAGRPGRPDEIAAAVAWLLSTESAHVTGQDLEVAGGWML